LADLMIFYPLGPIGPTNFKNADVTKNRNVYFVYSCFFINQNVIKF
jgi:hypothetical protein